MNHPMSGGFIGLIALLITSLLMGLFYWGDLFSGAAGGKGASVMERNLHAVQSAKDVKKMMENRTAEEMEQLAN